MVAIFSTHFPAMTSNVWKRDEHDTFPIFDVFNITIIFYVVRFVLAM